VIKQYNDPYSYSEQVEEVRLRKKKRKSMTSNFVLRRGKIKKYL